MKNKTWILRETSGRVVLGIFLTLSLHANAQTLKPNEGRVQEKKADGQREGKSSKAEERSLSLKDFLDLVMNKNKKYQSSVESQDSALEKYVQNDLELSPVLMLRASQFDDQSLQQTTPTYTVNRFKQKQYSLGLAKKFSTGTSVSVEGVVSDVNINAVNSGFPFSADQGFGSGSLSLSQSLWKNAFGSATRLRWKREEALAKLESESFNLQARQTLIEAESAFWELLYLQREVELRKNSLDRANRIQIWVRNRLSNGIGDKADLLNAQGLVVGRELQLLQSQDQLIAAEKKISEMLQLEKSEKIPSFRGDLNVERSLFANIKSLNGDAVDQNSDNRIVRLDAYLKMQEAKARAAGAQEAEDATRPDLVLEGQYKTNAYGDSASAVSSQLGKSDRPTSAVALKLTWLLDGDVKEATRRSARKAALAAKLHSEQAILESETSWSEMQRRHGELSKMIEASDRISRLQTERAAVERDKLSKGRSVTSQVITAEQEAAEAELNLNKLRTEQRKIEAQSRLFLSFSKDSFKE